MEKTSKRQSLLTRKLAYKLFGKHMLVADPKSEHAGSRKYQITNRIRHKLIGKFKKIRQKQKRPSSRLEARTGQHSMVCSKCNCLYCSQHRAFPLPSPEPPAEPHLKSLKSVLVSLKKPSQISKSDSCHLPKSGHKAPAG